ncbi:MAG: lamin tail domain-containing protein, partial [Verrucomicrobia bacterium]|nr:lamin tail domain-containing protein [Verrucomicrobiota bacterium]
LTYLVVARWVQENGDVWADMSLYHDNDGDGLWRIVPFDMNLSWGAAFGTGDEVDHGLMITNDAHKSFPMYGSSQALPQTGPGGAFNRVYDAFFTIPQTREMYLRRVRTLLDTYVKDPSTPVAETPIGKKVFAWRDLILDEANLDRKTWGWPPNTGQGNFDPGIQPIDGINDLLFKYVGGRRLHYQVKHSVNNTALPIGIASGLTVNMSVGIPNSQPGDALVLLHSLEVNPSSGNQDQEYICLTNPQPYAVDISGWQLSGAVQFTFHPGTVLPSSSAAFLTPSYVGFKSRTTGPRRGQGLFVIGPYSGHLSARGETLSLVTDTGRPVWTNAYPGQPSLAQQVLRITEIMYHPVPSGTPPHEVEDLEFIELRNTSPNTTLSLTGVRFTDGVLFDFTTGAIQSLAPGARVVVAGNLAAFKARYGAALPIAGQFDGSLDNAGERIRLVDAQGEEILDFTYNNGWYPLTDGLGFSLVCANELAEPELWNSKANWRPSAFADATPGAPDASVAPGANVVINEALSRNDTPGALDLVELYNPEKTTAEIGGWFLTDDFSKPKKFKIPPGTRIEPGEYLVFRETDFNQPPNGFTLSAQGEEIYLFSADSAGELMDYVTGFSFGAAENRVSFGRYVISTGESHYVRLAVPTLGSTNSAPKVEPVVISEIHYHPLSDPSQPDDSLGEFIELINHAATATSLFEPSSPTNTWSVAGGVAFTFPTNITLEAKEAVLLVNFDPQTNLATRAWFIGRFGVGPDVRMFGPYGGKLSDSGEGISLRKPIVLPDGSVKDASVEKVDYGPAAPWPSDANGTGASLQRVSLEDYGNDPANWFAAAPSPGKIANHGVGAPVISEQPKQDSWPAGGDFSLNVVANGSAPLRYQWRRNDVPLPDATNAFLTVRSAQAADEGVYDVEVFNDAGAVDSAKVPVFLVYGPLVLLPPRGVQVRVRPDPNAAPKTNVTLSVATYAPRALSYQWRRNGQDIPGANDASLVIQDVKVADAGSYSVRVQDGVLAVETAPSEIVPLVTPVILQAPLSQTVPAGSPVTLSIVADGFPLPMGVEWRRGNTVLGSNTLSGNTGFFTFNSTNKLTNFTYRAIVRNLASMTTNVSAGAIITTVADTDKDGIPDDVEGLLGLNPNLAADGAADADGDGMSNAAEFLAGTNPKDDQSYLRIDATALAAGAELQFGAISNRTYTIQFKDIVNGQTWLKLADFAAQSLNRTEKVLDAGYTTNRFYRVVTPRQQ